MPHIMRHARKVVMTTFAIGLLTIGMPSDAAGAGNPIEIDETTTQQAISFKSQTPTDRQIAIGRIMWESGQDSKAEVLFHEAMNRAQSADDKVKAADMLAEFYRSGGEHGKAIRTYEPLLKEAISNKDTATMIHVYGGIGATYADEKQFVKSIKSYRTAEELLSQRPDTAAMADIMSGMANTLFVAGDVREALSLIKRARSMTSESDLDRITVILLAESKVEAKLGDFEAAYMTMNEYSRLRRQLRDREADNLMSSNGYGETEEMRYRLAAAEGVRQAVNDEQEAEKKMAFVAAFVLCLLLLITLSGLAIVIRRMLLNRAKEVEMRRKVKDSDRVIHIVGHDATNQFNTLLGFASVLVQRTSKIGGDEETFAKHIYSSAQTLYQMTSNLLTWSKSQSQMKPRRTMASISDSLENVLAAMRVVADDKEIKINNEIGDNVMGYCDPSHLAIIIRNLISNAIKYTRHYGNITLMSTTYDHKLLVVVEDDGVGMPAETIASFNKEETLTSTDGTDNEKGNGIGLTICRHLAKVNGGDLIFEPGRKKGTSVTLVLPTSEEGTKDK